MLLRKCWHNLHDSTVRQWYQKNSLFQLMHTDIKS